MTHDVEIYARDEIPAGAQLTTSYVSAGLETNMRRQQLYDVWNFWCRCDTCRDNTECGSYRCVTTRPTGRQMQELDETNTSALLTRDVVTSHFISSREMSIIKTDIML